MTKRDDYTVIRLVIATGIASVVTQLYTIREYLVEFKGNEFVIALILFCWLVLGGAGTMGARLTVTNHRKATLTVLGWLSILIAVLSACQLIIIRELRDLLFIHGVSVGFYATLTFIFLTLLPYGLLIGFVLPYSLFVVRSTQPAYSAARIYITDNLGDVSGGVIFSFILVHLVSPLQAIALGVMPLIWAAFLALRAASPGSRLPHGGTMLGVCLIIAAVVWEPFTLAPKEGKLVFYQETRYGRITVQQDREQYTLFSDGVPLFSNRNPAGAEETVHYPLSQLDTVRNVLVISAEAGMLRELTKYAPKRIDYVELDPVISDVLFRYGFLHPVPALQIFHEDGRTFLKHVDRTYDAVLVNLPEPDTFQINRFFTGRFYALVKSRLAPNGILSFSLEGYDNYLAEPQRRKMSSIYVTLRRVFRNVILLPGERVFFLCSDAPLRTDIPSLLAEKGISTAYISRYYAGNVNAVRIDYLNQLMDPQAARNQDTFPRLMGFMFNQWFAKFATSPIYFFIAMGVGLILYLFILEREAIVLFATGCTTMASEVLVIFAFQIYFGFIYQKIGLIVTVFLAGLLPGAWVGDRLRSRAGRVLVITDCVLIILILMFMIAVDRFGDALWQVFFMGFGFAVSFACGCQFPAVLQLLGDDNPAVARSFSADLVGAAYGTLLPGLLLLPYVGVLWTAGALVALKCMSLILAGWRHGTHE